MHVQSVQIYCFSLSNMQICRNFVAVVIVVASALYYRFRDLFMRNLVAAIQVLLTLHYMLTIPYNEVLDRKLIRQKRVEQHSFSLQIQAKQERKCFAYA